MYRLRLLSLAVLLAAFCLTAVGHAATICPTTSYTNTDCAYILTIGMGGAITGTTIANANAYDGSDDALIGLVNNSGATYSGSFSLTGSGNGGGLFAFEGDGICTFVTAGYCATASTGYEGPDTTFTNILNSGDTGTVNVAGLANGASTYFSLESSPASINSNGGITIGGGGAAVTPEPSSLLLLGTGVLGVAASVRRRLSA